MTRVAADDLVSVIIPTRDRPDSLAQAVRSALGQTHPSIEVWVVDDGSTPPATLPPELAADARVELIRLETPIGPPAARNLASERCRGRYLAFLDDDDQWLPEKVERQVEVLVGSPPSVAAVQCGWDFWDGERVIFRFIPDPDRDLPRLLLERPCMAPTSVLMRRNVFDELGRFDPTLRRNEDWDLWLRLADRYEVALMPDVLAVRRGHPGRILGAEELPYRLEMMRRLAPRIAGLPEPEARRVRAGHWVEVASFRSQAGDPWGARRALWTALRISPRSARLIADRWMRRIRSNARRGRWSILRALRSARRGVRRFRAGTQTRIGHTALWRAASIGRRRVRRILLGASTERRDGDALDPAVAVSAGVDEARDRVEDRPTIRSW